VETSDTKPETTPAPAVSDPALDPARMDKFYADLTSMNLVLDADPLELGPKRLNSKIAECRGYLTRCERIFLELSQDLHRYKSRLRTAKADMHLAKMDLFANDPEVRMGRNVADRDAIASNRLRAQAEEIDFLTSAVEDLSAVVVVVKAKRADLKDSQGRLKDQLKVCQEEISLGARWGRSFPPLSGSHGSVLGPAQDEVNLLMASVMKEKKEVRARELPPVEEDITIPEPALELPSESHNLHDDLLGDKDLSEAGVENALDNLQVSSGSPTLFEDEGIDALFSTEG